MPFLPFIPFVDCAEVVVEGVNSATAAYLTLGFKFNAAITPADMLNLADIIETWYHTNVMPNITPEAAFNSVKITDLTTAVSPVIHKAFTGPNDGTAAPPGVSNQDALVVTFNTTKRGRSYRGRNYIPALPVASRINGTLWSGAVLVVWDATYAALAANTLAAGWQHVVLSRQENNVRRVLGVATTVVNYDAKQPIGTQRRRIIGRGI